MGGAGGVVEIDETFFGNKEGFEVRRGAGHKNVILSLVERGGEARSFHVESTKKSDILPIVKTNIEKESHVMSDEAVQYAKLGKLFDKHGMVDHSREEWGWTDRITGVKININSAEGYYSIFKRGMIAFISGSAHRYLAEFDSATRITWL